MMLVANSHDDKRGDAVSSHRKKGNVSLQIIIWISIDDSHKPSKNDLVGFVIDDGHICASRLERVKYRMREEGRENEKRPIERLV